MTSHPAHPLVLGLLSVAVLVFIYFPLVVVLINSFNASKVFAWPPTG
jgi:putative spermidine/putrescine transport system permease protein